MGALTKPANVKIETIMTKQLHLLGTKLLLCDIQKLINSYYIFNTALCFLSSLLKIKFN